MPTYLELKEQAEKLLAQAEQMRQQEREAAIQDIRAKMGAYGITVEEVAPGRAAARARPARRAAAKPAAVQYRGPNGETWSGGRGRKPRWVTEALAQGKRIEDFRVA